MNGRIAPFLELGVGFQPELTAEDNMRLYGTIMGMKFKNFSSGMYARLAFATAVFPLTKSAGG